MQYKIVFSDLDGTLLSKKKDISGFTAEYMRKLQEIVPVILVSARMPKSMIYVQSQINGMKHPLICYNGALIVKDEEDLFSKTIAPESAVELFEVCKKLDVKLGLYHKNEWYTEVVTERIEKEIFNTKTKPTLISLSEVFQSHRKQKKGFHKIMCMGTKEKLDELAQILANRFSDVIQPYRSNDTIIEVSPKSTSKLQAVEKILDKPYQLSLSEAMAFGDNYNDIEMIRSVGHGVAVANAREEVKEVADAITLDYQEDGVATYVKQMFNL